MELLGVLVQEQPRSNFRMRVGRMPCVARHFLLKRANTHAAPTFTQRIPQASNTVQAGTAERWGESESGEEG